MEIAFAEIVFPNLSSFIFKEDHIFIEEEDNSPWNFVKVEEELDGIDANDIWNLKDLLRLVFIDKECGIRRQLHVQSWQ